MKIVVPSHSGVPQSAFDQKLISFGLLVYKFGSFINIVFGNQDKPDKGCRRQNLIESYHEIEEV